MEVESPEHKGDAAAVNVPLQEVLGRDGNLAREVAAGVDLGNVCNPVGYKDPGEAGSVDKSGVLGEVAGDSCSERIGQDAENEDWQVRDSRQSGDKLVDARHGADVSLSKGGGLVLVVTGHKRTESDVEQGVHGIEHKRSPKREQLPRGDPLVVGFGAHAGEGRHVHDGRGNQVSDGNRSRQ